MGSLARPHSGPKGDPIFLAHSYSNRLGKIGRFALAWTLGGKENPPDWSLGETKEVTPKAIIDGAIESYSELISLSR